MPTNNILELIGLIENPKFTGTFSASYNLNNWNLRYGLEWIDATDAQDYGDTVNLPRNRYDLRTPDYFLHSASIRYEKDNFGLTLGVRNIFNTNPPTISAGYTNLLGNAPLYSGYDQRGRTFFVGAKAGF